VIRRVLIYAAESLLLAALAWLALRLSAAALRDLGRTLPRPGVRVYFEVFLVFLLVNAAGSELWGPEFLLPYRVAAAAVVVSALLWVLAMLLRRWRVRPR
jgi:hypothetical protein